MPVYPVTLTPFSDTLINAERCADGDPYVRSTLLLGDRLTIVFDTLYCPADMDSTLEIARARERPVVVINSHADYDHVWGNGAFPDSVIVGHGLTRKRFLDKGDVAATLARKLPESCEEYGTVVLRPPEITFIDELTIEAGGFSVVLHHLPGHRADCIVAHIPQAGILLAADTAEDPIPVVVDGPLRTWSTDLRHWARRHDAHTIIPSHGPISGPELLVRNADYLDSLIEGRSDGWEAGPDTLPFYSQVHLGNVARAAELLSGRVGLAAGP
ncbi:MAG TPA: MBL fold metallo-hydrolase [Candidatus Dormibacteraeota bacterium]|nr:MBL fold metallo-hydrolase [Candidatus Dormibacteraeota bacterium]